MENFSVSLSFFHPSVTRCPVLFSVSKLDGNSLWFSTTLYFDFVLCITEMQMAHSSLKCFSLLALHCRLVLWVYVGELQGQSIMGPNNKLIWWKRSPGVHRPLIPFNHLITLHTDSEKYWAMLSHVMSLYFCVVHLLWVWCFECSVNGLFHDRMQCEMGRLKMCSYLENTFCCVSCTVIFATIIVTRYNMELCNMGKWTWLLCSVFDK